MAGEKSIKRQAQSRTALIGSLLDKLENKVQAAQRGLLKLVINDFLDGMEKDDAGNIKNTLANKRRLAMFDNVFSRYAKDHGLAVAQSITEGVGRIVDFNAQYFSAFTTAAELAPINANVKQTLSAWLGISTRGSVQPNGYLDTLIKDATVKNQVKNLVLKSVVSQAGYFETKKSLQDHIEGTPDKLGALQRYYRNFAYDTFSVVDRTNGKIFADKLKFNYAIYEGGLIETSRDFCEEHNGKVYSREEIAKFKPTEAIGPGYDPFTDLGGYGCRHHLNWVPDNVAFALRPELKAQQAPAKEEPAAIEQPGPKEFNFKTVNEAKQPAADIFNKKYPALNIEKVQVHNEMSAARLNMYLTKLDELTAQYNIFPGYNPKEKPLLRFESTARYYGSVTTAGEGGTLLEMNFGHKVEPYGARRYVKGSIELRGKSRVDPENTDLATVVHEFAHVMGTDRQANVFASKFPEQKKFWTELTSLKRKYKIELGKVYKYEHGDTIETLNKKRAAAYEIHLGDYASTNANEFMAEAWTEYKLSSNPSKYALLVGKLIDKYFKK